MTKYFLPIPLFVLLFNTITHCQQRPLGMLTIPASLANAKEVRPYALSKYYTMGYEPMVGDAVMEPGSWDGFEDKIRIWLKLSLSFNRSTKFVIYKTGAGAQKTVTGLPDPDVQMSALSVKIPVSYKGTALKTLEFHFGFDKLGNLKTDQDLFIPASLLKNYDKVGTANKIAGGGKEDIAAIFSGLTFGIITVTHFEYFKFAEQLTTETTKLTELDVAARKKEEADRVKADADKKKADEEAKKKLAADEAAKKKAAEEKAAKDKVTTGSTKTETATGSSTGLTVASGSSSSSGSTGVGATAATTPEFGKGPDGNYYRKGTDGKYKQISTEEYQNLKKQSAGSSTTGTTSGLTKQQQDAQLLASTQQKLQNMTNDFYAKQAESQRKAEQFSANMLQSYYAAEAVRTGKANLKNASSLTGNYSSVEELEAEFNEKYAAISTEVENLNQARNQQLQTAYNSLYSDASASSQAIGQAATTIGTYLNNMKAEKEEREAKEALRRQREEQRARIEARKREALIALRKGFFNEFPDGGVPLSGHKVTVDELYFFSYVFDKNKIDAGAASVKVSNVFPVARYGDGTWPFKNNVMSDVKKAAAGEGPVTLVGYYATKEMANSMRTSFLTLASKCQITIKDITCKGRPATGGAVTDFWGNGTKEAAKATGDSVVTPVKKKADDFWHTGEAKKAAADTTKKAVKKDDFWNN